MDKFKLAEKVALYNRFKSGVAVKVAKLVQLYFLTQYNKEENPEGQPWPRRKRPATPARKLLVRTGKLKESIQIKSATFSLISVGTDVEYAKYHNLGTNTIPQRQFLGESQKLEAEIGQFLEAELDKIFK